MITKTKITYQVEIRLASEFPWGILFSREAGSLLTAQNMMTEILSSHPNMKCQIVQIIVQTTKTVL